MLPLVAKLEEAAMLIPFPVLLVQPTIGDPGLPEYVIELPKVTVPEVPVVIAAVIDTPWLPAVAAALVPLILMGPLVLVTDPLIVTPVVAAVELPGNAPAMLIVPVVVSTCPATDVVVAAVEVA
jgi:hypothetical protein